MRLEEQLPLHALARRLASCCCTRASGKCNVRARRSAAPSALRRSTLLGGTPRAAARAATTRRRPTECGRGRKEGGRRARGGENRNRKGAYRFATSPLRRRVCVPVAARLEPKRERARHTPPRLGVDAQRHVWWAVTSQHHCEIESHSTSSSSKIVDGAVCAYLNTHLRCTAHAHCTRFTLQSEAGRGRVAAISWPKRQGRQVTLHAAALDRHLRTSSRSSSRHRSARVACV
jgi:hypothetical protein